MPPWHLIALVLTLLPGSASDAAAGHTDVPKPTIVLVHGAFADASAWNDVVRDLQKRGYTVYASANPLRGLISDSDYLRSFLATIPGPHAHTTEIRSSHVAMISHPDTVTGLILATVRGH